MFPMYSVSLLYSCGEKHGTQAHFLLTDATQHLRVFAITPALQLRQPFCVNQAALRPVLVKTCKHVIKRTSNANILMRFICVYTSSKLPFLASFDR